MTIATYLAPNKTIEERYEILKSGDGSDIDALKEFSEAARDEMLMITGR